MSHSICKWFFVKISIYHILMIKIVKKNSFMIWKLSKFSNGSQIWFKLCEMTCEITTIFFMKIQNNFNHIWNIFAFLSMLWHVFVSCKYTPSHNNIKRKWFLFFIFGLCFIVIWKNPRNSMWFWIIRFLNTWSLLSLQLLALVVGQQIINAYVWISWYNVNN